MKIAFFDTLRDTKKYLNEGFVSLFFHFLKSVIVLYINWLILNKLNKNDYVTWSITSSILMIATASDLGIGQHTVTLLIHTPGELQKGIIINACIAMMPLFLFAFIFVLLSLSGSLPYVLLMALFVSLRLFSIPFGAYLNATNNFQQRKIIEFVTYLLAAGAISVIVFLNKSVFAALLALNISFIAGGIITIYITLKNVPTSKVVIDASILKSVPSILRGSMPFLVNNLTILLTYGGFIWISSFVLPVSLIAKLSVLHSFLFMTIYQVYDVFLRSKQADFIVREKIIFFLKLNRFVILITPIMILLSGMLLLKLIAPSLQFSYPELALFSLFVIIEFCYLIIQSIIQVDFNHAKGLFFYSFVKFSAFILAFAGWFVLKNSMSLTLFLSVLNLFSLASLIFSNNYFKAKTSFSIWG